MKYLYTLSALAAPALATVYNVTVGPGLVYSPDSITDAAQGDVIAFNFLGGHNVASGSFDSPCQPAGDVYSGDMPSSGDVFSVTLNDTEPLWIYCAVPGHCQGGMVMVVNPTADKTLDDYKSAAAAASDSSAPTDVSGGVFGVVSDSGSSSSTSAESSSTTDSASSTASSGSSSTATSSHSSSSSHSASAASTSASSTSTHNGAAMTGVPMAAGVVVMGLAALL